MPRVALPLIAASVIAAATASAAHAESPAQSPPPLPTYTDQTPPIVTTTVLTRMRGSLLTKGIQATVVIDEPGSVVLTVRDESHRQVSQAGSGTASLPNGGGVTLTVKLTAATRTKVRRGAKVRWTIDTIATDAYGNTRVLSTPFRVR